MDSGRKLLLSARFSPDRPMAVRWLRCPGSVGCTIGTNGKRLHRKKFYGVRPDLPGLSIFQFVSIIDLNWFIPREVFRIVSGKRKPRSASGRRYLIWWLKDAAIWHKCCGFNFCEGHPPESIRQGADALIERFCNISFAEIFIFGLIDELLRIDDLKLSKPNRTARNRRLLIKYFSQLISVPHLFFNTCTK